MRLEQDIKEKIAEFNKIDQRGSYYPITLNLIAKGFEIEAYLLILATWNFAIFRYAVKEFNIENFKEKMSELAPSFDKLKNEALKTIDFDAYKNEIETNFNKLSAIKGIQYTGASKIMHLKNRHVFVMWDSHISGQKSKTFYEELDIAKTGSWNFKRYAEIRTAISSFLKTCNISLKM